MSSESGGAPEGAKVENDDVMSPVDESDVDGHEDGDEVEAEVLFDVDRDVDEDRIITLADGEGATYRELDYYVVDEAEIGDSEYAALQLVEPPVGEAEGTLHYFKITRAPEDSQEGDTYDELTPESEGYADIVAAFDEIARRREADQGGDSDEVVAAPVDTDQGGEQLSEPPAEVDVDLGAARREGDGNPVSDAGGGG